MSHWQERMACHDTNPEVFFPTSGNDTLHEARKLCDSCPVRDECLTDALRMRDTFGFRGGKTGDERRRLRAQQPKPDTYGEIRRLRGKGWTNRAICVALGVSDFTVSRAVSTSKEAA